MLIGGVGELGEEREDREEPRVGGDLVLEGAAQSLQHLGATGGGQAQNVSLWARAGLGWTRMWCAIPVSG
jgi:hypothetical protein